MALTAAGGDLTASLVAEANRLEAEALLDESGLGAFSALEWPVAPAAF